MHNISPVGQKRNTSVLLQNISIWTEGTRYVLEPNTVFCVAGESGVGQGNYWLFDP